MAFQGTLFIQGREYNVEVFVLYEYCEFEMNVSD